MGRSKHYDPYSYTYRYAHSSILMSHALLLIMVAALVTRSVIMAFLRSYMRRRHNIRGTPVEDFCYNLFCPCLVTCQMMAEVSLSSAGVSSSEESSKTLRDIFQECHPRSSKILVKILSTSRGKILAKSCLTFF